MLLFRFADQRIGGPAPSLADSQRNALTGSTSDSFHAVKHNVCAPNDLAYRSRI